MPRMTLRLSQSHLEDSRAHMGLAAAARGAVGWLARPD
jgi:hypothetical protein